MLSLLADALMIATRQQPFHKEPSVRQEYRWAENAAATPKQKVR